MLAVVSRLFNVLSVVLSARGQQDISDLLKTASVLVREVTEGDSELDAITKDIEEMVELGIQPTDAQIAAVRERRNALQADIDEVVIPDDEEDEDPVEDPVEDFDPVDEDPE